jgi:putative Holliday junction resolvase
MKIIGVDFGSKRVGIAIADTATGMAFPKTVIDNDKDFFENFRKIMAEEKADQIVLGESKDFEGKDNAIMGKINEFKKRVENDLGQNVNFQPEFMTSQQAGRLQGENEMLDASAACIILQAYMDKQKQTDNK